MRRLRKPKEPVVIIEEVERAKWAAMHRDLRRRMLRLGLIDPERFIAHQVRCQQCR